MPNLWNKRIGRMSQQKLPASKQMEKVVGRLQVQ